MSKFPFVAQTYLVVLHIIELRLINKLLYICSITIAKNPIHIIKEHNCQQTNAQSIVCVLSKRRIIWINLKPCVKLV